MHIDKYGRFRLRQEKNPLISFVFKVSLYSLYIVQILRLVRPNDYCAHFCLYHMCVLSGVHCILLYSSTMEYLHNYVRAESTTFRCNRPTHCSSRTENKLLRRASSREAWLFDGFFLNSAAGVFVCGSNEGLLDS